jgi:hypothetical protein
MQSQQQGGSSKTCSKAMKRETMQQPPETPPEETPEESIILEPAPLETQPVETGEVLETSPEPAQQGQEEQG